MSRIGVRGRVVGAFAAVVLVLLGAGGVAIRAGVSTQLTTGTDRQLEVRAAAVARLLVEAGKPVTGLTAGLDDPGETFTQVIGSGERVVLVTPGIPSRPLLGPNAREDANEGATIRLEGVDVEADEGDEEQEHSALEETTPEAFEDDRARVLARNVTVGGTRYAIIVGATLEDEQDALDALDRVLLIALPLALLLTSGVAWLALRAALQPVETMRQQASGISDRSLDERLELPAADDELRRLGETLNAMLDRLAVALERERGFVSDASHELRTPLAILQTELELALRGDATDDDLRAAIRSALEETGRLGAISDGLLLLARSDHGTLSAQREPVDLTTLAEVTATRFGLVAPVAGPPGVRVSGDAARLEQALANLVENAVRHGGGDVELVVQPAGGGARITVADRGPGVPPDFLPHAFERFSRADRSRTTSGTGLGLAITEAIAQAHGGSVRLAARDGGGTVATLELPAS